MKYLLTITLCLLTILCNIARAQVSLGFKGGLNIGRFLGPGVIRGASSLTGGNVGIFENVEVSRITIVQIQESISWEGENFNNPLTNGSFKFTYFNLPIIIQQKIYAGLFAETGPQIGLLLSAKQTITTGDPNQPSGPITSDYSNSVKSLNFGWDFGFGYEFLKLLSLEFRYNLGISNLGSKPNESKYRNSVLSFNLSFKLAAKKNK
jgi:hypothetical protein